jgi:hypothetical protein
MSDQNPSAADPFGQIADEFVEAFRRGQRPAVEEFACRYPAHADEIHGVRPDGQPPFSGGPAGRAASSRAASSATPGHRPAGPGRSR